MSWHHGPPSPYATTQRQQQMPVDSDLRERVRALEVRSEHQADKLQAEGRRQDAIAHRMNNLEEMGRQAVASVRPLILEATTPLELRIKALELGWWSHLQPHLWKVYTLVFAVVASRLYKWLTGAPLDVFALIQLLKG